MLSAEGNPGLESIMDILNACGLKKVAPIRAKSIKHRAPTPHKIVTRSSEKLNR